MRDWAPIRVAPAARVFCSWCGAHLAGTIAIRWAGGDMDWRCALTLAAHSVAMPEIPWIQRADNPAHRHCSRPAA